MRSFKEIKQLAVEIKDETKVELMTAMVDPSAAQKKMLGGCGAAGAMVGTVANFMAVDFTGQAKAMGKSLFSMGLIIANVVFFLVALIGFIMYGASSDPQSARQAKDRIKRVVAAWIGINLIGLIAATVAKLTAGGNNGAGQTSTTI